MCRRWFQIALQLPASLSIDLSESCSLDLTEEQIMADVEQLLRH